MLNKQVAARPAFMLVELIVAMAIIGLLIAAGAVSLNRAQQSNRDATRTGDLLRIQSALSSYARDNRGFYPSRTLGCASTLFSDIGQYLGAGQGAFPSDPRVSSSANTGCAGGGYAYSEGGTDVRYQLIAGFERRKPSGESQFIFQREAGGRIVYALNGPGSP